VGHRLGGRTPSGATPAVDPWWDLDSLLDKVDGPIGVAGWHAVGRTDLTRELVVQRTERFLESVLARC
jgi:hypothetical protein